MLTILRLQIQEDSAMETDVSAEAISLSPDTSRISLNNSPHSSATKGKTLVKAMEISSGEENPGPRNDLEEGEIDSDARSSPEHSPEHDPGHLFPQRAHPNYLPDSPDLSEEMSTGSPSSFAHRNIAVEKVEAKNTQEKKAEFETAEIGDDYKTIPVESSSDEGGDNSGKEEADEAPDTDVLSGSASSDFSDDEDINTKRRHRDEPVASNLESMDGDSDSVRSSRSSIVGRGRQRDAEAVKSDSDAESEDESTRLSKDEKARSVYFNKSKNNQEKDMRSAKYNDDDSDSFSSKIQARSQQYSDEDSSGHFRTKVAKSQKYSDDSDDVIAKIAPKSKNHSDNDSDNDVIDHLEIAAPQQALIKGSKKKSSKDKSHKARSSSKDERQKKQKDKREEGKSREKERRERKDNHEKNYGKYKERKYEAYDKKTDRDSGRSRSPIDKKADRDSGRPRSPVEKKSHSMAEEDLRKKLLQKRSTRDDFVVKIEKDQRDVREVYHKDEKNPRHDKIEKRRSEPHIRVKKEDNDSYARGKKEDDARLKKTDSDTRGKKEEKASESSKKSKTVKEGRDERDKSYKKDKSPSKKRRREKTKSEVKKRKTGSDTESKKTRNVSDIDSSDDDDDDDEKRAKEARKSSSKKLRTTVENTADADNKTIVDQVLENEAEDNKDYDYDDISPVSSEEMSPPVSPIELKKPTYYPAIMGCRDVKEFHWLNKIEEGTYGVVYRARDCRTEEIVALKRLKMEKEKEGFPITSLREINTLLKAQHPNIVTVREIVVGSNMDKIYIVMDYVEHDLKALMETMTQPFLVGEVKTLMIQLLRGVQHMHDNWILHRDIKASNLLLSHKGILKIGDFGLAREYGSPLKQYTTVVVTLWYRAPELLLGGKMYATAIDLWSCGCVFAELLTMKPLFPGKSEIDQINKIFKELGTPTDAIWPGPPPYSEYPMVKKTNFANHPYNILRQKFGATLTDKGFNLLNKLLTYDPSKRITAEEALKHEFFEESPLPVDPSMFPTWPAKSELAHRAVRKHNASPKAPEGGAAASKVANDDSSAGFHMPAATKGFSAKGAGFNLKF